jgi:hypothetical protein
VSALRRVARAGLAALSFGFVATASAGTVQDAAAALGRGDYAAALVKIKSTTTADWLALHALAAQIGDSLYSEITYDHLALIQPDPAQPVLPPSAQQEPRPPSLEAKADTTCRFAVSFHVSSSDGDVRLWAMPGGARITTLSFAAPIRGVGISQTYVAIAGAESVNLYDVRTGTFLRSIATRQGRNRRPLLLAR